ncbi:MAG: hypothetical protein O3A20_00265, partial [Planctomycetota bacterium]|nr:hypothetical protein [Planctomycetota bacterium]
MQFHKSPLALVGALLAAAAVGLTSTHNGIQAKQANSSVPFQDDDLDGLDNAMEVRLGSNPFKANVDGDGLNDLAEILLGTDPSVADSNASLPALSPRVQLEAYQVGGSFVLQSFMLRKRSVKSVHFYIAQSDPLSSNPYA